MKKQQDKTASNKVAARLKDISKEQMSEVTGGGTVTGPAGCRTCGIMQVEI